MKLAALLLLTGLVLVVTGIAVWSVPAAMVVAGAACVVAAYVRAYFFARSVSEVS